MKVSNSLSGEDGSSFPTGIWEAEEPAGFLVRLFCLWKKLSAGGVLPWGVPALMVLEVPHSPVSIILCCRCQITVQGGQGFARGWSTMGSTKQWWVGDLQPGRASGIWEGLGCFQQALCRTAAKGRQLLAGAGSAPFPGGWVLSLDSGSCSFLSWFP